MFHMVIFFLLDFLLSKVYCKAFLFIIDTKTPLVIHDFLQFFPIFLVTLIKGTCLLRVELTDLRKMSKLILGSLQQKASS